MKKSQLTLWLLWPLTIPARLVDYLLHGGYQPTTKKEQRDERLLNSLDKLHGELRQLRETLEEQA